MRVLVTILVVAVVAAGCGEPGGGGPGFDLGLGPSPGPDAGLPDLSTAGPDAFTGTGADASPGVDAGPGEEDGAATGTDGSAPPPDASADLSSDAGDATTGEDAVVADGPGEPPADMTGSGPPPPTGQSPLPCADPTVLADHAQPSTVYVFCTGMRHVWKTSDWTHFTDEHPGLVLNVSAMPALGRNSASWWAPTAIYDDAHSQYVMWASVQDLDSSSRSLAVLTSPAPLGPWTFQSFAKRATASGQNHIDPMLFRNSDGTHYVYWKHYGGGIASKISGAKLNASLTAMSGAEVAIMNGYNSTGWELNVRENPAVWQDTASGTWHMLYSGAHWRDDSYATGHAVSSCGPLCLDSAHGGWHIAPSHDRNIAQVVQAKGDAQFTHGGPGGAVWADDSGHWIVYAAASRSSQGDGARYLQRDRVSWSGGVPFVDNAGHHPSPAPTH
jgi:hypothetical protein